MAPAETGATEVLIEHLQAVEQQLLATSRIPANSGHTLHRGTPREAFIRQFLEGHLSERVAIGTGEIISAASRPREARNQFDIVIYKRDYPRLDLGGGINAFLAESVVATVEVKSILDRQGIVQAIGAARTAKSLPRHVVRVFSSGYQPPGVLNYVIAYDGPNTMTTVRDWVHETHLEIGNPIENLPLDQVRRAEVQSPSLDAIFVLGKGFWYFDNVPVGLVRAEHRAQNPELKWVHSDSATNNLLLLFLFLTVAVSGISGAFLNPTPYMAGATFGAVQGAQ